MSPTNVALWICDLQPAVAGLTLITLVLTAGAMGWCLGYVALHFLQHSIQQHRRFCGHSPSDRSRGLERP